MDPLEKDDLPPLIAKALGALDARAAKRAASVDVERVAGRVLARLRTGETPVRSGWRVGALSRTVRIAASVVVMVAAGAALLRVAQQDPAEFGVELPILGADSLTQIQADSLVRAIDEMRLNNYAPAASAVVGVDQLNAQELRALLQALQTSEGET